MVIASPVIRPWTARARRRLSNGDIGIVTVLHERMHQVDRFREEFGVDRPDSTTP